MFITLTSADDGKELELRASAVVGLEAMDRVTTRVILAGGADVYVRETRAVVRDLVELEERRSSGFALVRPPAMRSRE